MNELLPCDMCGKMVERVEAWTLPVFAKVCDKKVLTDESAFLCEECANELAKTIEMIKDTKRRQAQ